jgi:ParB/RepB/Spo0J family partition protein
LTTTENYMAKVKRTAAPADGIATAGNPQNNSPFPTPPASASGVAGDATSSGGTDVSTTVTAAPSRVQVSSLRLYTDPARNQVERLVLEQLLESPFNPRTHYAEKALNELADTIRGVGVMEPILVRPVTTPGVTIQRGDQELQAYEIVFGHRRTRAVKIAGEDAVPAIVRDLTDAQAAQLQAIENVQRQDLDAMEEALGYAHYCRVHGVTKDQLAEEIGLSRTHVYSSLKLLDGVQQVQDALRNGKIGKEVAILVSRLPSPKLQEKALKRIEAKYWDLEDGGKRSYRHIRDMLREEFTLDLKSALFKTTDGELVPLAGACTTCPKRTGNAPEFADLAEGYKNSGYHGRDRTPGDPNICTDPECWDVKKKAHLKVAAASLEAKGKTVIDGNKARAAISVDGVVKGAYVALKDVKAMLAKTKEKGKNKGKATVEPPVLQTVLIQNPRDGKTVEAVAISELKTAGVKVAEPAARQQDSWRQEQVRRDAEEKANEAKAVDLTRQNMALLQEVRKVAGASERSVFDLQMVAAVTFAGADHRAQKLVASLHGVKSAEQMTKLIGSMRAEQLTALMLDCALADGVEVNHWNINNKPDTLLRAAKHYGIDPKAIKAEATEASPVADTQSADLFDREEVEEESEA